MSSNLEWRPTDPPGDTLCDELKFILRKSLGDPVRTTMTTDNVGFLSGVAAASDSRSVKKDCQKLIAAIEANGSIDVDEVIR